MKDRIFYQSDSSGNVGAHDIKGSHERQKKGATSAASNQGRRHPLGNPDKTVPTDLRNDISRRLSKACCSAYIVELLYGNHGLLFRASEIYQYYVLLLPQTEEIFGDSKKLWDHIQYALWKETFGVSSQTKSPDGLSKCLFTQMYSLGRSLHTYTYL